MIELLSDSTRHVDKGEKMIAYQDKLRVPEYYWYDPFSGEFAGFALEQGVYQPLVPAGDGGFASETLGLRLVRWQGEYEGITAEWIRWATPDGAPLPLAEELESSVRRELSEAQRRVAELEAELARYREQFGDRQQ